MTEQPTRSNASETDPPAANQPLDDDEAADATPSPQPPATGLPVDPAPEIVRGKPDGEVDTRR
jgi:hypothetical protein